MTAADLNTLKANVGRVVEIEAADGEIFLARVISVFDEEDSPDLFYWAVSRAGDKSFVNGEGYAIQLSDIKKVQFVGA